MIKTKKTSANWDKETVFIFCDLCIKEVELGNRPTAYLIKEGWQNIIRKFKKSTGRDYDRIQLKNKWDQLKKNWKIWKELKRGSTDLGWNPIKRTVDASDDWWAERLAVVPAAKKFKVNGIDPRLEEKLDRMFECALATNKYAFAPIEAGFGGISENLGADQTDDSIEDSNPDIHEVESTSGSEDEAFLRSQISQLVALCTNDPVSSQVNSVRQVMQILDATPEVLENKPLYFFSMKLLEDSTRRQFFIAIPADRRVAYLRYFYRKSGEI